MELLWEARGSIIYKKEQGERAEKSRARKKLLNAQKMEKAPSPTSPRVQAESDVVCRGREQVAVEEQGPGLLLSAHSLHPLSGGPWEG